MKDFLEKRFRHGSLFREGVTVGYALDYFAWSGDFRLCKKTSKKQSAGLWDDVLYDDVITDWHYFYRVSDEEKKYYLTREEYWKRKEEKKQKMTAKEMEEACKNEKEYWTRRRREEDEKRTRRQKRRKEVEVH